MAEKDEGDVSKNDWAEAVTNTYWIPRYERHEEMRKIMLGVVDAEATVESLPFQAAFRVLTDSVQSVQKFLSFPYDLARGIMDLADIPNSLGDNKDHRLGLLVKTLTTEAVAEQLQRIKQQAVVLLWSAYETYSRDIFVASLNVAPTLYGRLQKSPLKDKFHSPTLFSFAGLESEDFNLAGKLGSLLAEGRDFSSPALLRSLFQHLFSGSDRLSDLAEVTESRKLWLLGHRRHVVAHRGGVVDQAYMDVTGDTNQAVGHSLVINGHELDDCMSTIAKAASLILICALTDRKSPG